MNYLEDFLRFIPDLSAISMHGIGQGGGETVCDHIISIYKPSKLKNIIHSSNILTNMRLLLALRRSHASILFTAGPRDLPYIIVCLFTSLRIYIYLQVPYKASCSLQKDILHWFFINVYLFVLQLFRLRIFCNSSSTASQLYINSTIIVPIRKNLLQLNPPENQSTTLPGNNIVINFVCRMNIERGIGSKDLLSMKNLIRQANYLSEHNNSYNFLFNHYGEASPLLLKEFYSISGPASFVSHGYIKNWQAIGQGVFVFFSNYEGFGLAPFEAYNAGYKVIVNRAFPQELKLLCPNITVIDTNRLNISSIIDLILL